MTLSARVAILLLPIWLAQGGDEVRDNFRLCVDKYKQGWRISWWAPSTRAWPENCKGFNVLRRVHGSDEWQRLNSKPILPRVFADVNFSLLMTDRGEIGRLREALDETQKMLAESDYKGLKARFGNRGGKYAWVAQQLMLLPSGTDILKKTKDERGSGAILSRCMEVDPDFAFFCGFAYYDSSLETREKYGVQLCFDGCFMLLPEA